MSTRLAVPYSDVPGDTRPGKPAFQWSTPFADFSDVHAAVVVPANRPTSSGDAATNIVKAQVRKVLSGPADPTDAAHPFRSTTRENLPTDRARGSSDLSTLAEQAPLVKPMPMQALLPTGIQLVGEPEWVKDHSFAPSASLTCREEVPWLRIDEESPERVPSWALSYVEDAEKDQQFREWLSHPISQADARAIDDLLNPAPQDFKWVAQRLLDANFLQHIDRFIVIEREVYHTPKAHYSAWLATMRHFTANDTPLDRLMAEAVFHMYHTSFQMHQLKVRPVFELLRNLLRTNPASLNIPHILYPTAVTQRSALKQPHLEISQYYLQSLCESQATTSECLDETWKVMKIARSHGLEQVQELAIPFLQRTVRNKDFEAADALLEVFSNDRGPRGMQNLNVQYAMINAHAGNWEEVETALEELHAQRLWRADSVTLGRVFTKILSLYSTDHDAASCCRFAAHFIKHAGVVPSSTMSEIIIHASIRDGRHDLIGEWQHAYTEEYSHTQDAAKSLQGSWKLTKSLDDLQASSQAIANVLKALAGGSRRDPYSPGMRQLLVELVRVDMARLIAMVSPGVLTAVGVHEDIASLPLESLVKLSFDIRTVNIPPEHRTNEVEVVREELALRTSSIVDIANILRGDTMALFSSFNGQRDSMPQAQPFNVAKTLSDYTQKETWPEFLNKVTLSGILEIKTAVVQHCYERHSQGLPVDQAMLKYFIDRVGPQHPMDVLEIVEAVLQGENNTLDPELVKAWLYLVATNGASENAKTVLRVVERNSDNVPWTLHFRLLCDLVAQLGDHNNEEIWTNEVFPRKPHDIVLKKLHGRIHSIWQRKSIKSDFKFPDWKGW
jgi:hypothetical protein